MGRLVKMEMKGFSSQNKLYGLIHSNRNLSQKVILKFISSICLLSTLESDGLLDKFSGNLEQYVQTQTPDFVSQPIFAMGFPFSLKKSNNL